MEVKDQGSLPVGRSGKTSCTRCHVPLNTRWEGLAHERLAGVSVGTSRVGKQREEMKHNCGSSSEATPNICRRLQQAILSRNSGGARAAQHRGRISGWQVVGATAVSKQDNDTVRATLELSSRAGLRETSFWWEKGRVPTARREDRTLLWRGWTSRNRGEGPWRETPGCARGSKRQDGEDLIQGLGDFQAETSGQEQIGKRRQFLWGYSTGS